MNTTQPAPVLPVAEAAPVRPWRADQIGVVRALWSSLEKASGRLFDFDEMGVPACLCPTCRAAGVTHPKHLERLVGLADAAIGELAAVLKQNRKAIDGTTPAECEQVEAARTAARAHEQNTAARLLVDVLKWEKHAREHLPMARGNAARIAGVVNALNAAADALRELMGDL